MNCWNWSYNTDFILFWLAILVYKKCQTDCCITFVIEFCKFLFEILCSPQSWGVIFLLCWRNSSWKFYLLLVYILLAKLHLVFVKVCDAYYCTLSMTNTEIVTPLALTLDFFWLQVNFSYELFCVLSLLFALEVKNRSSSRVCFGMRPS